MKCADSTGEAVHSAQDHVKVELGVDLLVKGRDGRMDSKSPICNYLRWKGGGS